MSLIFTAKGQLLASSASAAVGALAAGTDGYVLTADSAQTLGVKWAAAAGAGALTQISLQTLSGSAATVSFSSISGSYSALRLLYVARTTSGTTTRDNVQVTLNADTGANYNWSIIWNSGASFAVGTSENTGQTSMLLAQAQGGGATANYAVGGWMEFPFYAGTSFYKTATAQQGASDSSAASGQFVAMWMGQWKSTAAITTITLTPASGSFATGSAFVLYGLS